MSQKPKIAKEKILRVYSGAPGCACGCRGNYSESKRSIALILKRYEDAPESAIESHTGIDGNHPSFVFWDNAEGTRTYTIYFKPE